MGHSQADKALSRERILEQASAQIRGSGLESVSFGKLMRSAKLTRGGFYGRFASRSDLLLHALDAGNAAFDAKNGKSSIEYGATVRSYLSHKHRDARTIGCTIAARAGDVARADLPAREAMSTHIERFIGRMDAALGGDDPAMADEKRADAVLSAAKRELLALQQKE